MDQHEAKRRINYRQQVEAYFRAHPAEWIPASTLLTVGGRMAWRTRVADARKVFEAEGGVLFNKQTRCSDGSVLSEYRYVPNKPLGRDSTVPEPTAFTSSYQTNERLF